MVDYLESHVTPSRQYTSHVKVCGTLLKMDVCVLAHVCARLIILIGGKNNHKIKIAVASWQSAFAIHPFDCEYTNILIVLTACIWREGV